MLVTAEPDTSYAVTNNKAEVVVTLPAEAQPGQVVRVEGFAWVAGRSPRTRTRR